jgi:hypothetical protein
MVLDQNGALQAENRQNKLKEGHALFYMVSSIYSST